MGRRAALLGAVGGLAGAGLFARAGSAAPAPEPVTEALVAAARKEGAVVFHSSIELSVCQSMVNGFNQRYPDIRVQLERSGAERILQRITQEYASNIHAADFVESSDMGTFVGWKQKGWLAPYVPVDVARFWPAEERDPDGQFASLRVSLSVIAYNSKLIKPEEAPRSFADLLAPRWRMRMVKAHPGYSGTILTSTYATQKVLGWEFFEKLAKQRVLQVQSAADPPKKVAQGERPVMVDGSEYVVRNMQETGEPIVPVYATEGTPLLSGQAAVMVAAPHPNAARLFASYVFSAEGQQLMADSGNLRSFNAGVKPKPGQTPLADIKLLRTDPNELAAAADEVKRRYAEIFGV
ncbi:MAG: ABC transporter substrate-binding protein [Acetobacteraceae bacterium]